MEPDEAAAVVADGRVRKDAGVLSTLQADELDGDEFQDFVAKVLKKNGYAHVEVTGKSGDRGDDPIATKDDQKIAIRAKRYTITRGVSNVAVQEAYAAVTCYEADAGTVVTNTFYTRSAKDRVEKAGIKRGAGAIWSGS